MPVSADVNDTIPFSLSSDLSIAEEQRPTFLLRFLTEREDKTAARLIIEAGRIPATTDEDDERKRAILDRAIRVGLVDICNVRFRGADVTLKTHPSDYLSDDELWELANAVLVEPRVKEADRKKSGSQSTIRPANSASDAVAPAVVPSGSKTVMHS